MTVGSMQMVAMRRLWREEALSRIDPQQRDLVIRTIVGEAANQGERGMQAVAAVIGNRMAQSGRGGDQVVLAPNQFEPWGMRRRALGCRP